MKSKAESLLEIAETEIASKKYENGLELYSQAYREAVVNGQTDIAIICCRDMAATYDRLEKWDEAISWLDFGAELARFDVLIAGGFSVNRGITLLKQHKFGDAAKAFDNAATMIGRVPPKLRTHDMHSLRDTALENLDVARKILAAQAAGMEIEISTTPAGPAGTH